LSFLPKKQSPAKPSILCFLNICQKAKIEIIEAATSDRESYFPSGTKRLIRILKRTIQQFFDMFWYQRVV